jgi:hypothetical protein
LHDRRQHARDYQGAEQDSAAPAPKRLKPPELLSSDVRRDTNTKRLRLTLVLARTSGGYALRLEPPQNKKIRR